MGMTKKTLAFIMATTCLVLMFMASAAPIPLYGIYREQIGLTQSDLSLATVSYFAGTIGSLLVFTGLSNHIGRKPAIWLALAFCAAGCLLFASIDSPPLLFFGRFVQGLSCGIASGHAGAYVVDNAPSRPSWIPAVVTTSGPQVGFALGSFSSALITDGTVHDTHLIFLILIACCAACAVALVFCKETMPRCSGVLHSLLPKLSVPRPVLPILPICCCAFVGAWAVGGFFQTFSSALSLLSFGSADALPAAIVLTLFMGASAAGAPLVGRIEAPTAQRVGLAALLVSVVALAIAAFFSLTPLLLVAAFCCGASQSAAFSSAMRRVLARTEQRESAGVLSAVSAISYAGAAIPNLAVGIFGGGWHFEGIVVGYAVLVAACLALACLLSTKERQK